MIWSGRVVTSHGGADPFTGRHLFTAFRAMEWKTQADMTLIGKNIHNLMHAALAKRNAAAYPNAVVIDQVQTDAYISDLITNVVQKIV